MSTRKSKVFMSQEAAIKFLIEKKCLLHKKKCPNCNTQDALVLKQGYGKRKEVLYRCNKNYCRFRASIFALKELKRSRLELPNLLHLIFMFILNTKNYAFTLSTNISEKTYIRYKK